ncbi:hypothetical protein M2336_003612 [Sphingobium sp. B1D7B]|uniref:hypothetical protein n=1 Tax=Sphingobium sp. B1D7B TaxID=2940578 RepID=UPI0022256AF2|nr:hypothetical protein [Sphingobium sp. B1D7B]MCW2406928.1 hypothetical protein [Sphingobium sp. B1D7B]
MEQKLVRAIEGKNLNGYSALLDDKVVVTEDGKEVARSKEEWLSIFGSKLGAKGVVFRIEAGYSSFGKILLIEYFNSMASWGRSTPAHCCWSYDAVSYDIGSTGKIIAIRRLQGGDKVFHQTDTRNK